RSRDSLERAACTEPDAAGWQAESRGAVRMASDKETFARIIQEDREAHAGENWRGTFLDYLERVRDDPPIPKLAHARIYDVIARAGSEDIQEAPDVGAKRIYKDEPLKVFNFFREEFFGIEKTIAQIVRYFHSAALKGEESRQVLYLMGPVGS